MVAIRLLAAVVLAASCVTASPLDPAALLPCAGVEDYQVPDGRDYRGTVNTTRSGLSCQRWDKQKPHQHTTPLSTAAGIGQHNYCRNPFGGSTQSPGCFTQSPAVRYELCAVGGPCNPAKLPRVAPVQINVVLPPGYATPSQHQDDVPSVTFTSATPGALIFFSVDGAAPTIDERFLFAGRPVAIPGAGRRIIMAFAAKAGHRVTELARHTLDLLPPPLSGVGISPLARDADLHRPVLVTLRHEGAGAVEIWYTLDGSTPVPGSVGSTIPGAKATRRYLRPFWVKEPRTSVFAVATLPGRRPSAVVGELFDVEAPRAQAPVITARDNFPAVGSTVLTIAAALAHPMYLFAVNTSYEEWRLLDANAAAMVLCPTPEAYPRVRQPGGSAIALRVCVPGRTLLAVTAEDDSTARSPLTTAAIDLLTPPAVRFAPRPGLYHGPVVVSIDATGQALPLEVLVNGEPNAGTSVSLTDVGTFTVEVRVKTVDFAAEPVVAVYELSSTVLPEPELTPFDGPGSPPTGFIFASPIAIRIGPLPAAFTGVSAEVHVTVRSLHSAPATDVPAGDSENGTAVTAAPATIVAIHRIDAHGSDASRVVPLTTLVEGHFEVEAFVAPPANDPIAARFVNASTTKVASFVLAPTGSAATPYFRVTVDDAANGASTASGPGARTPACRRVAAALQRHLALADRLHHVGVGAAVGVLRCSPYPVVRIENLGLTVATGYARWALSSFNAALNETTPRGQLPPLAAAIGRLLSPVAVTARAVAAGCATVSSHLVAAVPAGQRRLIPEACVALHPNATQVAMASGGVCMAAPPGTRHSTLPDTLCTAKCDALPLFRTETCGAAPADETTEASTVVPASFYDALGARGAAGYTGSATPPPLFAVAFRWRLSDASQLRRLTTTRPFSMSLDVANCPAEGGLAKFVHPGQSCRALAPEFRFKPDGLVPSILLRSPGTYRVCVRFGGAGSDSSFAPVAPDPNTPTAVSVVSGADIPVTITPPAGTFASLELAVKISSPNGTALRVAVDHNPPYTVDGSGTAVTLSGRGSHVVTATGLAGQIVGMPVTAVFTLDDSESGGPVSHAPTGAESAKDLGFIGYELVNEPTRAPVQPATNGPTAPDGPSPAAGGEAGVEGHHHDHRGDHQRNGKRATNGRHHIHEHAAAVPMPIVASGSASGLALRIRAVNSSATMWCAPRCEVRVVPPGVSCAAAAGTHPVLYGGSSPVVVGPEHAADGQGPSPHGTLSLITARVSLATANMTAQPAVVCIGPGPIAGRRRAAGSGRFVELPPLPGRMALNAAVGGIGACPHGLEESMCRHNSFCAARPAAGQFACVCPPSYLAFAGTADAPAPHDPFCFGGAANGVAPPANGTSATPVESKGLIPPAMRGRDWWNGTVFAIGVPADENSGGVTPPPTGVPPVVGSYASLFVLVLIFAVATGALCSVKLGGMSDAHLPHPEIQDGERGA